MISTREAQRERERERESAHELRDPAGCQSAAAMNKSWGPAHRALVRFERAPAGGPPGMPSSREGQCVGRDQRPGLQSLVGHARGKMVDQTLPSPSDHGSRKRLERPGLPADALNELTQGSPRLLSVNSLTG